MIRIGFLIDRVYSWRGGTELQLRELIHRLDRTRFTPVLICLHPPESNIRTNSPCEMIVLGYEGFVKRGFPGVVRQLAQVIRQRSLDIVHTFFEESVVVAWLATLLGRQRPLLVSSRRDVGLIRESWYLKGLKRMLPLFYVRYDSVVVNCEAVRRYAQEALHVPLRKIHVIRNGMDLGPPPASRTGRTGAIRLCMTANLTPVKRHDLLLRALAKLRQEEALSIEATLLGEGPERHSLERLASQLGITEQVEFAGSVMNVRERLMACDVGVLCSDREGLSNAILEYMEAGLPVVATAVGGNTELVTGSSGLCVAPGDTTALAAALAKLIRDDATRLEMGRSARRLVEHRYSWNATMAQWHQYYSGIAARSRRMQHQC